MPSSSEIKQWLVDHFHVSGTPTKAGDWRRVKKHKDAQGRVRRVFQHPVLGDVAVVETDGGLELDSPNPNTTTPASRFTRPSWSASQTQAAKRLMDTLRDGQLDVEDAAEHPDYLEAHACLPSHFSFCFPADTYGNEGQEGVAIEDRFGELCVWVKDVGGSDPDEYLPTVIRDRLEGLGLSLMDEYHWGLDSREGDVSIEEMVRRLISLGLAYDPDECMLAKQLMAAGATRPSTAPAEGEDAGLTQARQDFFQALKNDDEGEVQAILQRVAPKALADLGDGRTWVRAAFEAHAYRALALLLRHGAPVFTPTDRKGLMEDRMGRLWRDDPAQAQVVLRLLVEAPGWDPEHALASIDVTQGQAARDEWAQAAWPSHLASDDPWLAEAWNRLARRVGETKAHESFAHAWCMHAFLGKGGQGIPARVAEGLAQHPTLLNTWPDRRNPRPWQALTRWCESPGSWDTLFGVARQLGVDLPNLGPVGDTGQTFLEWARARQLGAKQAVERERERSRTGFTIVMTHRDGRQVTQQQEYLGRWSRALAMQNALEQWDKPGAG